MLSEEEKMCPLVGETQLSEALINAGKNLFKPHSSTKELLHLLNEAEAQLSKLAQDPIVAVQKALRPLMKALVSAHLLRNRDTDVRVYVVSCLTEIMRITAPEAPYNDDQMKEIFKVTVKAFGKLGDATCHSYEKAVTVLDTVSRVRLSLVMLDLECDDLILKMFRQFLKTIRPDHPESVLLSMEAIMVTVIHESEEVTMDLLEILLAAVNKESQDFSPMASWLVEKVLISCACKLQPWIMKALKSAGTSLDMYSLVVLAICQGEAEAYIVVKPKQVEGQHDFRLSRKRTMSKTIARCGTRVHGDDKVRDGNDLKQILKQVQSVKKDDPEEEKFMKSDLEKPKGRTKTAMSSKKEKAQNGSAKASAKKPMTKSKDDRAQNGLAKTSAKKLLAESKESEQTAKSQHKRKRTAGEEVESHKREVGEELVGKKLKVWWPLDKKFYEGVIKSYCSRKKKHEVSYSDGDVEILDLRKERWEIIQDNSSFSDEKDIDLPDSTLLSDIMRRHKAMKSKNVLSKNVELSSSSDVRSSKKKEHVTNSSKQGKRTKGSLKGRSNEPESRQEQNVKSSEEPDAETGRTKGRTEKRQRVTRAMHRESEKDCDDKEELETKGDDSLCKRGHQELPDGSNAETKAGGEELKSNAKPEIDVEEKEVGKELIAEHETVEADHKVAIEPAAKAGGEERESAKETPADTKLIEEEDISEDSLTQACLRLVE